ncbi:hypothetical protein [Planctomycetes bacterium K23_9]|uniref:Bacterial membrane protein YfhO n=1 Tax=Stieleria marina TaxID=1930275 RepID=A0A517NVP2_9BACT|nr:hypothetical protein K239x_31960 [Planctomycetes bacterium K23_9]
MLSSEIRSRVNWLLVPIALAVCFGSVLTGSQRLAFRDVSHFYTPLYRYVALRTNQQWLPLWNPLGATGMPLMGETTTAVLYPVRFVIFALPVDAETAIGIYAVFHLLLAAIAAAWLAKRAGVKREFTTIAGIVYAFSGSVFFLHTNLPFLVGASWLPFVLGLLIQPGSPNATSPSKRTPIRGPAFALAMMVLGGDPQTALHCVIVLAAAALVRSVAHRDVWTLPRMLIPVVLACSLAALMSAPQIAASLSWSQQSSRVVDFSASDETRLQIAAQRRDEAYQFSLPPWHLSELVTPWASGSLFPKNQRISSVIAGDGRMWTPTIYVSMLGLLALMCSVADRCGFRKRHQQKRQPEKDLWLALAATSLLLSLGHFGFTWLIQQFGFRPQADSAVGGLYWFLYQYFPFYDSYRYPTKWLPFFSIAAAVLSAQWVQSNFHPASEQPTETPLVRRSTWLIIATILTASAGTLLLRFMDWQPEAAESLTDEYWGPLDYRGALNLLSWSLFHSGVVVVLVVLLVYRNRVSARISQPTRLSLLLILLAVDLVVCHSQLTAKVNRSEEQAMIAANGIATFPDHLRALRMQSGTGWPKQWRQSANLNRLAEVSASERVACFGRWHLDHQINVFNGMSSIRSRDVDLFWRSSARLTKAMNNADREVFWQSVQTWLQLNHVIFVDADQPTEANGLVVPTVKLRSPLRSQSMDDPVMATFCDRSEKSAARFLQLLDEMAASGGRQDAVVFSDQLPVPSGATMLVAQKDTAANLQIHATQHRLLTRPVYQDGHWHATLTHRPTGQRSIAAVHNVDFLKQGVIVPPGDWSVSFTYQPGWLKATITISVITWLAWLLYPLRTMVGSRRSSPNPTTTASSPNRPGH